MSTNHSRYLAHPQPTPDRPLLGNTVLVVEDSRFASEAIRLLCQYSGARIRRADSLAAAHRHLAVYRPTVVIADIGLPDGSGTDLIAELAQAAPNAPVLIGMSGDRDAEEAALSAGANGFLAKPVESVAAFQQALLIHLPVGERFAGPRAIPIDRVAPDKIALIDDLAHVVEILRAKRGRGLDYVAQFLRSVARSSHDAPLFEAVERLNKAHRGGRPIEGALARLTNILESRLAAMHSV